MMHMLVFDKRESNLKSKIILSFLCVSKKIKGIYSEERHSCSSDTSSARGSWIPEESAPCSQKGLQAGAWPHNFRGHGRTFLCLMQQNSWFFLWAMHSYKTNIKLWCCSISTSLSIKGFLFPFWMINREIINCEGQEELHAWAHDYRATMPGIDTYDENV